MKAGDKVLVTKDIWDDGEDHHPPGWLAKKGETLVVKGERGSGWYAVAHEGRSGGFLAKEEELEALAP